MGQVIIRAESMASDDETPVLGMPAADELPPELADRYEAAERLGAGVSAIVLRARRRADGRAVVVKLLRGVPGAAGDELSRRFGREARAMAALDHPRVVRLLEVAGDDGAIALVMEHAAGGTLRARLEREGRLAPERAIPLALDLLEGLAACHAAGLVHRDVKPENVLLTAEGRACVADLGCVRRFDGADSTLTRNGSLVGTPRYMAPEQLEGEPGPASDVYAAGLVLHEMLTGSPAVPHEHLPQIALFHHDRRRPEPVWVKAPGLSVALDGVVEAMLEVAPAARPPIAELPRRLRAELARATAPAAKPAAARATGAAAPRVTSRRVPVASSLPAPRPVPVRTSVGSRGWLPWAFAAVAIIAVAAMGLRWQAWLRAANAQPPPGVRVAAVGGRVVPRDGSRALAAGDALPEPALLVLDGACQLELSVDGKTLELRCEGPGAEIAIERGAAGRRLAVKDGRVSLGPIAAPIVLSKGQGARIGRE